MPDDDYDEFVISTFLSGSLKPNTTLYFPVVQECEQGVSRWIEIPARATRATRTRASAGTWRQVDAETVDGASHAPDRRSVNAAVDTLVRDGRVRACLAGFDRSRDGRVLAAAPKTVQLRFNEAVTPAVIKLIDAAGRPRDDATVRADGETIVIMLPEDLPRGTQVVSYRVISADGHPVGGSMVFSIGAVTGTPAIPERRGLCRWSDLAGAARGLFRALRGCRRRVLVLG